MANRQLWINYQPFYSLQQPGELSTYYLLSNNPNIFFCTNITRIYKYMIKYNYNHFIKIIILVIIIIDSNTNGDDFDNLCCLQRPINTDS